MSEPHLVNQAVMIQTLHDLRNGQLRRCLAMGFSESELEMLKQPELVALLIHARVPWCKITVDREMLHGLAAQVREAGQEVGAIDRLLRLGASSEMLCRRYALAHQEVALRRELLGLPRRKGRYPTLTEAQEADLWRAWQAAVGRGLSLDDEDALLAWAADLAEAQDWPLAVIWTALRHWIGSAGT